MQFLLFLIYFFIIEKYTIVCFLYIMMLSFLRFEKKKKRGKKDITEEFDDAAIGSNKKINN